MSNRNTTDNNGGNDFEDGDLQDDQEGKIVIFETRGREADPEAVYGDLWEGLGVAIRCKRLVIFRYKDMWRIVEPHAVGRTKRGYWALSGHWYLGFSETAEIPGWRSFVLHQIEHFQVLQEGFRSVRRGFKPKGGRVFYDVRLCAESGPEAA